MGCSAVYIFVYKGHGLILNHWFKIDGWAAHRPGLKGVLAKNERGTGKRRMEFDGYSV